MEKLMADCEKQTLPCLFIVQTTSYLSNVSVMWLVLYEVTTIGSFVYLFIVCVMLLTLKEDKTTGSFIVINWISLVWLLNIVL